MIVLLFGIVGIGNTQTVSSPDAPWSGYAQCQITVQGQGYSDQQTHTWQLTGGQPKVQGAIRVHPATWSSSGTGGFTRTSGGQTQTAQWTRSVQNVSAPIGILLRASDGTLIIKAWHGQLRPSGGVSGTLQVSDGTRQSTSRLAFEAFEWAFPVVEASGTSATIQGSKTEDISGSVGPMQPAGSTVTSACTWQFSSNGNAASPPPQPPGSTTNPGSTNPGSTNPGSTNPGSTNPGSTNPGSTNPGSTNPGSTNPGSTNPGSTNPGNTNPGSTTTGPVAVLTAPATVPFGQAIVLSGEGSHATGAPIRRWYFYMQSAPDPSVTLGQGCLGVQPTCTIGSTGAPLPPGPYTFVLLVYDAENVYSQNPAVAHVTVEAQPSSPATPSSGPESSQKFPSSLTQITPASAFVGQQSVSVALTGQSTHFAQKTTKADFGPGITVSSIAVASPTKAIAIVNVDSTAAAGARTVALTTGQEVASLKDGFQVGLFSNLIPKSTKLDAPALVSVTPGTVQFGPQLISMTVTGRNTHFAQGYTVVDFGLPGIGAFSTTEVTSPTSLKVDMLFMDPHSQAGAHSVVVTTNLPDGNAFETAKLDNAYTLNIVSGKYRIVLNGFRANHETHDDWLSHDGHGDEVYAAAAVEVYNRRNNTFTAPTIVTSAVHGDINQAPNRVQAGSSTNLGGIAGGDVIPAGVEPATNLNPPSQSYPTTFPMLLWQGTLTGAADAVVIRPTLWEWDGGREIFDFWSSHNNSAEDAAEHVSIEQRASNEDLSPIDMTNSNGRMFYCSMLPKSSSLPAEFMDCEQGQDRPIGFTACNVGWPCSWSSRVVVITADAVEKALSAPNTIPGIAPGVIVIHLVDEGGQDWLGNYDLYLRVERIP